MFCGVLQFNLNYCPLRKKVPLPPPPICLRVPSLMRHQKHKRSIYDLTSFHTVVCNAEPRYPAPDDHNIGFQVLGKLWELLTLQDHETKSRCTSCAYDGANFSIWSSTFAYDDRSQLQFPIPKYSSKDDKDHPSHNIKNTNASGTGLVTKT
jgi:hypothetical protein